MQLPPLWKCAAHAGARSGAQLNGISIAKRILVVNPDHSTAYIPRRQAEEEVRAYAADWDDPVQRTRIYRRHRCDRGPVNGNFSEAWKIMPSEGMPVWQMLTR